MQAEIRIAFLIFVLAVVCAVVFAGCSSKDETRPQPPRVEDSEESSSAWRWDPSVERWEPVEWSGGWRRDLQRWQGRVAGFLIAGGAIGLVLGFKVPSLIGLGITALAVGMALAALNEVMDHWAWPYLALLGFLALAAWKAWRVWHKTDLFSKKKDLTVRGGKG